MNFGEIKNKLFLKRKKVKIYRWTPAELSHGDSLNRNVAKCLFSSITQ